MLRIATLQAQEAMTETHGDKGRPAESTMMENHRDKIHHAILRPEAGESNRHTVTTHGIRHVQQFSTRHKRPGCDGCKNPKT